MKYVKTWQTPISDAEEGILPSTAVVKGFNLRE